MNYHYNKAVREQDALRASFNELTRKVFGFDFIQWYEKGHWGEQYIPHVLTDDRGKVVSNISANLMTFDDGGIIRHFIQIGTVMTDPDYRGQGLNGQLLEKVLDTYKDQVDGFYLFANDSVLDYYPKFGFRAQEEYEYRMAIPHNREEKGSRAPNAYLLENVKIPDAAECETLYQRIRTCDLENRGQQPNDGFCLCDNLPLYQFWLAMEYEEKVCYLPEEDTYVIAEEDAGILTVYQIIGSRKLDMVRLASSYGEDITEVKLCYTPADKQCYEMTLRKEKDSTLFVMGSELLKVVKQKVMFPIISHA